MSYRNSFVEPYVQEGKGAYAIYTKNHSFSQIISRIRLKFPIIDSEPNILVRGSVCHLIHILLYFKEYIILCFMSFFPKSNFSNFDRIYNNANLN